MTAAMDKIWEGSGDQEKHALRSALRNLCESYHRWNEAENKPYTHEVWNERLAACDRWHEAYENARATLAATE
jgi:hypothetical protein